MADWVLGATSNPSHYRSRGGAGTPVIRYFRESTCASTAVIKLGDIVQNDTVVTTGGFRLKRAVTGGGALATALNTTNVVGIAVEASTSDGSTTGLVNAENTKFGGGRMIGVALAEPDAEFRGFLAGTDNVGLSSLIGFGKSIKYDSTNHIYVIDSTNTTTADWSCFITDIEPEVMGDTNAPVIFKFFAGNTSPVVK